MPDDDKQLTPPAEGGESFFPEPGRLMIDRIRKLEQHARMNVSAQITQKHKGAFTVTPQAAALNAEPSPTPISVYVYPQDPFVSAPEVREMLPADLLPGLLNSRFRVRDSRYPLAEPDGSGNYLFDSSSPQFNQVNAFYYATITLRMFERFAQRQIPWSFAAPRLSIDPHAGVGVNAYYHEQNRNIGFYTFKTDTDETINTAQSADVVSHETAHAVLDGIRDLFNESFGLGAIAFHESFGDMAAVLVALHDDSLVQRLLDWTENDLHVDNFVTMVAEHLIESLKKLAELEEIDRNTIYLRNAINKFHNKDFDEMPYSPADPKSQLGRESHNYSRLLTGAFYDVLVAVYEQIRDTEGVEPRIAIHRAREVMGYLLICAIECGPVGELTFADMARSFLTADVLLYDGKHTDVLLQVFDERLILESTLGKAHLISLDSLPAITLPPEVDSALDAGLFLVEQVMPALNLPDLDFTPMNAYTNGRGLSYLTYFVTREVLLVGDHYGRFNGTQVKAFGGLTLAFDEDRQLRSALFRPVTDEDERQILIMTADLIQHGVVTESSFQEGGRVLDERIVMSEMPIVQPRFVYFGQSSSGEGELPQLVRAPVILDSVPLKAESLTDYLQRWQGIE